MSENIVNFQEQRPAPSPHTVGLPQISPAPSVSPRSYQKHSPVPSESPVPYSAPQFIPEPEIAPSPLHSPVTQSVAFKSAPSEPEEIAQAPANVSPLPPQYVQTEYLQHAEEPAVFEDRAASVPLEDQMMISSESEEQVPAATLQASGLYTTRWPIKHGRIFLVPLKSELSSKRFCTTIHLPDEAAFYKVPEKHGHV